MQRKGTRVGGGFAPSGAIPSAGGRPGSRRDPELPTSLGSQGKQLRNAAGAREVTHMWTACQVIFVPPFTRVFTP